MSPRSEEWTAAMEAADWMCQCKGECGQPHRKGFGRCQRMGAPDAPDGLVAAPGGLFGAAGLVAACGACYDGARRRTQRVRAVTALDLQDELFTPGLLAG